MSSKKKEGPRVTPDRRRHDVPVPVELKGQPGNLAKDDGKELCVHEARDRKHALPQAEPLNSQFDSNSCPAGSPVELKVG